MARFAIIQAGTAVQQLNTTTGGLTTLTLPTDITVSASLTPRFAVFNKDVVMVNSPSRPIAINTAGTIRPLTLMPPGTVPVLTGVAGGALTGTFLVKQTFLIRDDDGNIVTESAMGPASASTAITTQYLNAAQLDISPETITASKLYRTVTLGTVYFPWLELEGNIQVNVQDDLADASLNLIAAPTLGSAPDLTLIAEWRGRLWGVARNAVDYLRYSEAGIMYAWPTANSLLIPKLGSDSLGVTALVARKDALGIGRRNNFQQIVGNTLSDFRPVKISENVGVESQESVAVYKDTAYFLWKDGVYEWDNSGIRCISDGRVRSWFTTDTYFNRGRFQYAFGMVDPIRNRYKLFLANAGDSVENRWVEYDLNDKTWWGPHVTAAVTTLTSALVVPDANDTMFSLIGNSTGFLWNQQSTATDNTATGISLDVDTKFFDGQTPDIEKYWGELSIVGKVQSAGTLTITPKTGGLDASAGSAISYTMTNGRSRLRRLGNGRFAQLNLTHSTAAEPVEIYGIELPFHELGRR